MSTRIQARGDYPSSNPEIHPLIDAAREQEWRVDLTDGGHVRFLSCNRNVRPIYTSQTPSDWRAMRNLKSKLRRSGLRV